jgi:hypothetical protein
MDAMAPGAAFRSSDPKPIPLIESRSPFADDQLMANAWRQAAGHLDRPTWPITHHRP